MLLNQADKICSSGFKPELILGISRGGIIPARILSDLLENPNLHTTNLVSHNKDYDRRKAVVDRVFFAPFGKKAVLVVDDVADTGKTLNELKEQLIQNEVEDIRLATLYSKPWSKVIPDYFEKETRRWIIFPWDAKENVQRIMKTHLETQYSDTSGLPKQLKDIFLKSKGEEKKS